MKKILEQFVVTELETAHNTTRLVLLQKKNKTKEERKRQKIVWNGEQRHTTNGAIYLQSYFISIKYHKFIIFRPCTLVRAQCTHDSVVLSLKVVSTEKSEHLNNFFINAENAAIYLWQTWGVISFVICFFNFSSPLVLLERPKNSHVNIIKARKSASAFSGHKHRWRDTDRFRNVLFYFCFCFVLDFKHMWDIRRRELRVKFKSHVCPKCLHARFCFKF